MATWGRRFGANADGLFGLCLSSIHRRYLYRFSTVFPNVVPHPASCTFVGRFPFINNLQIYALMWFRQHGTSNLPRRCQRPFFLYPSFPCLFLLVGGLFRTHPLFLYTSCGDRQLRILEFQFFASYGAGGTAPLKIFSFFQGLFGSGYSPDCFQPFPIVDIFSM